MLIVLRVLANGVVLTFHGAGDSVDKMLPSFIEYAEQRGVLLLSQFPTWSGLTRHGRKSLQGLR